MPNATVQTADLNDLNYAFGHPHCQGIYKVIPQDFIVEEQIAYELSGDGEHLWCWVEKIGENTDWVLQQLAKWAGVSPSKVGVAGQKDRHAVTRQWFSIQLPGLVNPKSEDFTVENVVILRTIRHQRKLQTGGLSGNRFTIRVRNIQALATTQTDDAGDMDIIQSLQTRLNLIKVQGVPNYYGEQRFGIHGRNIKQGEKLLAGELPKVKRNQKSLFLSAIRSWMFNVLLSKRLQQQNWNQLLPGEVLQLEGSNKWFVEDGSTDLAERVKILDIHPTGALFGKGVLPTEKTALEVEQGVAEDFQSWIAGLDEYGVNQDRRALRLLPLELEWQWIASSAGYADTLGSVFEKLSLESDWASAPVLQLSFTLRAGSYATMVMRELLQGKDCQTMLKATQNQT